MKEKTKTTKSHRHEWSLNILIIIIVVDYYILGTYIWSSTDNEQIKRSKNEWEKKYLYIYYMNRRNEVALTNSSDINAIYYNHHRDPLSRSLYFTFRAHVHNVYVLYCMHSATTIRTTKIWTMNKHSWIQIAINSQNNRHSPFAIRPIPMLFLLLFGWFQRLNKQYRMRDK